MFYDIYVSLCRKADVSPSKAAEDIGLSRTSVNKWKNGAVPSGATINKLADYFGVSVDHILNGEKAPSNIGEGHRPPDEETLKLLELLEGRPDIRYLAAASERATPEHVEATARMFDELYGRNKDN